MDVSRVSGMSSTALAADMAATEAARLAAGPSPDRIAEALDLAARVDDDSGKYSISERAAAYDQLFGDTVTGALLGASDEDQKTVEHAIGYSTIGKRLQTLFREGLDRFNSAMKSGGSPGRALVDFYDSLSPDDKAIYANQVNPTDYTGKKRYESVEGWRANYIALAEYDDYVSQAKASGVPETDAKFAKVQQLAQNARSLSAEDWSQSMLDLLQQPSDPVDRVQLSDAARARLGGADAMAIDARTSSASAPTQGALSSADSWGQALLDLFRSPAERAQQSDEAGSRHGAAAAAEVEPRETLVSAAAKAHGSLLSLTA